MNFLPRASLLACAALCLAAGNIPQSQGDKLTVTKKETKLRTQKKLLAPSAANLVEGDRVVMVSKEGPWVKATYTPAGKSAVTGWVHESDVTAKSDVRLSGQGIREKYSVSEAEAARKGFNPQVEKAYRDNNPNLEAVFALVDKLEKAPVSEAEVEQFLREGRLLKEGGQ